MSTVRMCDYQRDDGSMCGTIFSEREVGWSTGTITVIREDGGTATEQADLCPDHSPSARSRSERKYPRFRSAPEALPDARDWSSGREDTTDS